MYYRIADLTIFSQIPLPSFDAFSCEAVSPDVSVLVTDDPPPPGPDIRSGAFFHRQVEGGWFYHPVSGGSVGLIVDHDYSCLRLTGQRLSDPVRREAVWLIRIAVECRLVTRGYVSLHSAALALGDQAYAFSGPSGIGKSTRAAAWAEVLGGSLISGDRPLIGGKTLELFGVPWDGKEQCFRNVRYPLRVICDIRRSGSCYIRKLSFDQKRRLLMRQCFLPMWDTDLALLQMGNIMGLARQAEIIRIFCGPSVKDAANIYNAIENKVYLEEETDMVAKTGFVLRNIAGEYILMPVNENITKFNGTLLMNGISAFIWEKLQNPVSREDLIKAVLDEYDVDEDTARADLDQLLARLRELDVIEDDA